MMIFIDFFLIFLLEDFSSKPLFSDARKIFLKKFASRWKNPFILTTVPDLFNIVLIKFDIFPNIYYLPLTLSLHVLKCYIMIIIIIVCLGWTVFFSVCLSKTAPRKIVRFKNFTFISLNENKPYKVKACAENENRLASALIFWHPPCAIVSREWKLESIKLFLYETSYKMRVFIKIFLSYCWSLQSKNVASDVRRQPPSDCGKRVKGTFIALLVIKIDSLDYFHREHRRTELAEDS